MFVRFLETRRIRRNGSTIRFGAGEIHPFHPGAMQDFVDIGHARPCNEDGTDIPVPEEPALRPAISLDEDPAPAKQMLSLPAKSDKGEKLVARKPPFAHDDARRDIPMRDTPESRRDPVVNGGMTEA